MKYFLDLFIRKYLSMDFYEAKTAEIQTFQAILQQAK